MRSKFSWQNKILIFIIGVIAIILIYAKIFMWGMGYFEEKQVTLAQSV